MMNKFMMVLVALALAGAVNVNADSAENSTELTDVLKEFKQLLPQDELDMLAMIYMFTDSEFQGAINYVRSYDFKDFVEQVNNIEDVINFYEYMVDGGMDVYGLVNEIRRDVGLPPLTPRRQRRANHNIHITGGIAGYIADMRSTFPTDKIKALHQEKLKTSPAFANFIEHLKAPRFLEHMNALRANEEFQNLLNTAKERGIDIKAFGDLLIDLWGIEFLRGKLF